MTALFGIVFDDPDPPLWREYLDPIDLTAIALDRLCLQDLTTGFALDAAH